MKKLTSFLLAALFLFAYTTTGFAATASFTWSGTSTGWNVWTSNVNADGSTWYISWGSANLSEVTAKVKIWKSDGDPASHTFYYSSKSTASHSYLDGITNSTRVHVDGGRKTTGTTPLNVSGTFHP